MSAKINQVTELPNHCDSLLHLWCRSMGRAASESRSGCWCRDESSLCGGAGSWPQPATRVRTQGRRRSRSRSRDHERLPLLRTEPKHFTLEMTLTYTITPIQSNMDPNPRGVHQEHVVFLNVCSASNSSHLSLLLYRIIINLFYLIVTYVSYLARN